MQKFVVRARNRFPWYDSMWLGSYVIAKEFIQEHYPQKLSEFVGAFDVLRTDPVFQVKPLPELFPATKREEMLDLVHGIKKNEYEKHEIFRFGRAVVHDHAFFNDIQKSINALVSDAVNESVEPCYNFLSLYNNLGVCEVHMDAPSAKWTVDYCIEQSRLLAGDHRGNRWANSF